MEAIKEKMKRDAARLRAQAEHADDSAKHRDGEASGYRSFAAQARAEAAELDRVRVAVYGEDEAAQ